MYGMVTALSDESAAPVALPQISVPAAAPTPQKQGKRVTQPVSSAAGSMKLPTPTPLQGGMPAAPKRSELPESTDRFRKLSHAETVAMDGVECSYLDTKTGQIRPPWEHPNTTPQDRATLLQTYRNAVAQSGGTWNPYPEAAK